MEMYIKLGHKIMKKRKQLGLSQQKLAEICDLSQVFIANVEKGKKGPSLLSFVKIANAMNVSTDFLLSDSITYKHTDQMEYTASLMSDLDDYDAECINNAIAQIKKLGQRDIPYKKNGNQTKRNKPEEPNTKEK